MRTRPLVVMVILALTLVLSSPAQTAQTADAAIHLLLDKQASDWNRGDVDAFMKGYANSPQTTFVGQTVEYGYATILKRYQRLYKTPEAMGKLTFTHLAVRSLDPAYAVATGNFHLERTASGGGNAGGIFSLIFKREKEGWKIILDHTNRTN